MAPFLFSSLVPLVAALMIVLIAITYIAGKVFRIPQMEAYFNVELHNLVFIIIVLVIGEGIFLAAEHIANSLVCPAYGGSGCPNSLEAAKSFLNNIINRGVLPMYKDLLIIEAGCALSNSFMLRVGPSVWSFVYKVEPGADAILSMARVMSFGLLVIYASLSVQYIGLSFVEFIMPITLSLGMLLYIFPPTREAGSFLIALAFGFLIFFPFTYSLNQAILNDMWHAHGWGSTYTAYQPSVGGMQLSGVVSTLFAFATPFVSWLNFELLVPFINAIAHLALISLFLPSFSLTLTIAFVNAMTKFLVGKI